MATATKAGMTNGRATAIEGASNDGEETIGQARPKIVEVSIRGTADILFHRWSCDAVEAKSKAAKNSKAKKEDDVESYVYRCEDGTLGIPGEYLRQAVVEVGRYRQDPRSPRKSARDLYKAAVVALTPVATTGAKEWDYLDRRRVVIQRNGVTRCRPALLAGWGATFQFLLLTPEYLNPEGFLSALNDAGRLVGVADFRPTFGRFQVTAFKEIED